MAIGIDFLANVGDFLRGARQGQTALEDVADSLDDLASRARTAGSQSGDELASGLTGGGSDAERAVEGVHGKLEALGDLSAGKAAGDDLSTGVKSGGSDAERSVDSLEAKFRTLAEASSTQSTKVKQDISHSVKQGTEEASEGVETLKENTGSNLKEVAASFDGTWQGAASGAQGLLAELLEGFGPAGLLVGAVAAGGLGLILSNIEGGEEKTEEFKGKVSELTSAFIDSGRKGTRSLEDIQGAIKDLASSSDDTNLSSIYDDANKAGLDYKGVVAAVTSGNVREIEKERLKIGDLINQHKLNGGAAIKSGGEALAAYDDNRDAAVKVSKVLKEQQDIARAAGKAQEAAAAAGLTEYALKQKAIEQLHDAYSDAASEVDKYVDKESGLFDVGKYLHAMEQRQKALRDYQQTLTESSLSPEAKDYIESQGQEQAALLLAGYKKATPKQRDELNDIWTTTGRQNADSYGDALGNDLRGRSVRGPSVDAPSTYGYEAAVRAANARAQQYLKDHPLRAGAVAFTTYGKPLY